MKPEIHPLSVPLSQLVLVRPEPPGQYTAEVVGLPEIRALAATREEAIEQVRNVLQQWLATGHLVSVQVPQGNALHKWFGRADPNDPNEQVYLQELARLRREDLERTLREYEQECSNSSSTPTT